MNILGSINLMALGAKPPQAALGDSTAAGKPLSLGQGAHAGDVERGHRYGHTLHGRRLAQPSETAPAVQTQSADALTYKRSEQTTLLIQTQEGDTVRLKIKTRESLDAASATTQSGDRLVAELQLAARSSTQIAISVDGDLNPDELAAIQSVVEQAGVLADAFFAGDLQSAFSDAAALQIDPTQLAQVGLRLSVREQLTYTHLGTARPEPTSTPAVADASPSATGSSTLPATPSATAPTSAPVVADTSPPVTDSSTPPATAANVQQTIADFLSQLLDALGTAQPQDSPAAGTSLHINLKIKIFQSVLMSASSSTPTSASGAAAGSHPPLPALVPETLDALVAQQQPPLNAVA